LQLAPNTQRKMLPRMADTILSEHISTAHSEDRDVFQALALLPSGADSTTISDVLESPAEPIESALENGVSVGLLRRSGQPTTFAFRHELIREACAARCPDATARRMHQRIADALQGTPPEAYHRLCAGEETARSRACFLRAAEAYDKRGAPWEALRYFEAALKIEPQSEDADDIALRVARLGVQVGHAGDASRLLLQRLVAVRKPLVRPRYLQLLGDAYSREGRTDEALFHLQAAADLFRRYSEPDEQNRFSADLGRVLIAKSDLAGAIDTCTQALNRHAATPNAMSRAPLFLLKAQAERQSGDYAAAERTCRDALDLLKPHGRTHELAQAYTQIGTNYHYRGEFEQAERFYRAALKVHTELGDLQGMKSTHNNLGLAQMRAGRLEEAIRSYETSLELKRQLGDRIGEANSLNNLGNIWERRGEYGRALRCYRRGIQIFRRLDRPRELAILFNNMGQVHLMLGRFASALRHAERASRYAGMVDSPHVTLIVEFNRGRTLLRLWDTEDAARVLNAGLRRVRGAGMSELAAQFHACLSLTYARLGDARLAGEHLAETADVLPGLEKEARLRVRLLLAEAHECLGHIEASAACAAEAETLAAELERAHDRVRAWRLMAASGASKGDWDVAEALLQQAITCAREMGFRYELAKCYKLLGALHWDIGLRSRAGAEFERCFELLQALGLRTELGLSYLDVARLSQEGEVRS
jgi:tetratricopeptide (TPR) repeat protein